MEYLLQPSEELGFNHVISIFFVEMRLGNYGCMLRPPLFLRGRLYEGI